MTKPDHIMLDENEMIKRDFKDLIKQPEFRRFIWWLLEQTAPLMPEFSNDAMIQSYRSGKSDLGKQVMSLLLANHPDKYKQMGDERKSILKTREEANKDGRDNRIN